MAESQFNGDFAIAIRWLLDCSEGLFFKPEHELEAKLELVIDEVNKIKEVLNKLTEKPKEEIEEIKASDGSIRGLRKK